jgi:bifunctional DNase/RNase
MIELQIHAYSWCTQHQQPVVGLTSDSSNPTDMFWIGLTVEDARALSEVDTWPPCGRRRVHKLVSDILRATDSRLNGIQLIFNDDPILTAQISIESPAGTNALGCSSVDALLLASEQHIPLTIEEADWSRLQGFLETDQSQSSNEVGGTVAAPPDVFRDFIESLNLDQDQP